MIRQSVVAILCVFFMTGWGTPVRCAQIPPVDTSTPPAPAVKSPAPMSPDEEKTLAESKWQDINAAMRNIKSFSDKKQFPLIAAESAKIRDGVQWMVDHPGPLSADDQAGLAGVQTHIREFCEMLDQESSKGNEMTIKLCHRKLSEYIQSASAIYHTPPKVKANQGANPKSDAETPKATGEKPPAMSDTPAKTKPSSPAPSEKKK